MTQWQSTGAKNFFMTRNLMKRFRDSKNASFNFVAPFSLSICEERIRDELPLELRAWRFGKYASGIDVQSIDEQTKGFSVQLNIGTVGGHVTAIGFLKSDTETTTHVQGQIIISTWTKQVFFGLAIGMGSICSLIFLANLDIGYLGMGLFFVMSFLGGYWDITTRCRNALTSSIKESLHSFF